MKVRIWLVALVFIMVFYVNPAQSEVFTIQKEIEEMLVCQDDCGMLVSACDNPTATYMRGIITEQIAQGKNKEEILQHFVNIYGEKVLAAPPVKGFNITAWVTPFFVILLGGLFIYFALDKWVFQNRMTEYNQKELKQNQDLEENIDLVQYEQQLEDELKKYW